MNERARKIRDAVDMFREQHAVSTKGQLATILQLNRMFSEDTIPIRVEDYRTAREGQVKGLSGENCQRILQEYGITRVLAAEGGRTSRGSMKLMQQYAMFVNGLAPDETDYVLMERYWIGRVRMFFAGKPFKLNADHSLSIDAVVEDLLLQAWKRQHENPGTQYAGIMLQHLVAAKLSLIMPGIVINGAAVADSPTGRGGDFDIGDTVIHCTTAPGTPLIEKCARNIQEGLHPIIVTVRSRVNTAWDLAADGGIDKRVEIWDVQSFLSTNIHEHGRFESMARHGTIERIVTEYNRIVHQCETDPSLNIEFS